MIAHDERNATFIVTRFLIFFKLFTNKTMYLPVYLPKTRKKMHFLNIGNCKDITVRKENDKEINNFSQNDSDVFTKEWYDIHVKVKNSVFGV